MKSIASTFSIVGVVSGVLSALGPWVFGVRNVALANFLMPFIAGVVLMATHWLTFRRIQAGSGKRLGLLISNAVLLAYILLVFLFILRNPVGGDRSPLRVTLLAAVFSLPLACNVLYLSFKSRQSEGLLHGS